MGKLNKFVAIVRPLASMIIYVMRFLPKGAESAFLKFVRRIFNPAISSQLLEHSLCAHLKNRGVRVEVSQVLMSEQIPLSVSLDVADYIQRRFFLEGYPDFMPALVRFCDGKTVFFDIGANVGMISLGIGTLVPGCQIHAFEPVTKTFRQLCKNVKDNQLTIDCHQLALSDSDGEIELSTVAVDSGSATVDGEYLKQRLRTNSVDTEMQVETCKKMAFDTFWLVAKTTLSPDVTRYAFKIDVEGHELAVLSGMARFLAENKGETMVICETHYANIQNVRDAFESHGYRLMWPHEPVISNRDLFGSAKDLTFYRAKCV